jgi:hypothetical protein
MNDEQAQRTSPVPFTPTTDIEPARVNTHVTFDPGKIYPPEPAAYSVPAEIEPEKPKTKRLARLGRLSKKAVYLLLVGVVVVTFFTKNNYRSITAISQAAIQAPQQTATTAVPFTYNFQGVSYAVTPLFNYQLYGMVVSRHDYISDDSSLADNQLFPTDLCMIWGQNLTSGVYRESSTTFTQFDRFCNWQWQGDTQVINEDASNNHLMFTSGAVKRQLQGIGSGDQIKITGQLVDVETITPNVPPKKFVSRHSSTTRTDSGDGACEDILVSSIVVLQKNSNLAKTLYRFCLPTLGLLIVLNVVFWWLKANRSKKP